RPSPRERLSDSHIPKTDSASTGYRDSPLEPSSVATIDSGDSDDSLFSFDIRARTNQMCAYDSRLRGEVRRLGCRAYVSANEGPALRPPATGRPQGSPLHPHGHRVTARVGPASARPPLACRQTGGRSDVGATLVVAPGRAACK